MAYYPPTIDERFKEPKNCRRIRDANAEGTAASFECGTFCGFMMRVEDSGVIIEAGFRTNGCGYMVAAGEVLSELLQGKNLTELDGLRTQNTIRKIESRLQIFPPSRISCAETAIDAARSALARYREHRLEEFRGEKALICTCFGVSEETIGKLITENELTEVSEVSALSRAGSGCGACRMLIREMLDAARLE